MDKYRKATSRWRNTFRNVFGCVHGRNAVCIPVGTENEKARFRIHARSGSPTTGRIGRTEKTRRNGAHSVWCPMQGPGLGLPRLGEMCGSISRAVSCQQITLFVVVLYWFSCLVVVPGGIKKAKTETAAGAGAPAAGGGAGAPTCRGRPASGGGRSGLGRRLRTWRRGLWRGRGICGRERSSGSRSRGRPGSCRRRVCWRG